MRQIVLDTETTGLQPEEGHRIIEIGCIELVNRKFTGKRYHQYINPERVVEEGAMAVHGITNEFLQNKPLFEEIAQGFLSFIQGAELIIHNAPFDVGFINHEFKLLKHAINPVTEYCTVLDTLIMARQMHTGQRNSLDALCKRYNVDNAHREFHGALLDAHLLAQVYLAMTGGQGSLFDEVKPVDVAEANLRKTASKKIKAIQRKLIVLKADEPELKEHEARLTKMAEKGKCLWAEKN